VSALSWAKSFYGDEESFFKEVSSKQRKLSANFTHSDTKSNYRRGSIRNFDFSFKQETIEEKQTIWEIDE